MTKNNYIIKKTYVAPSVSFEDIEDEVLLFRPSANTTGEGGDVETDPNDQGGGQGGNWGNPAKGTSGDFVFELDGTGE